MFDITNTPGESASNPQTDSDRRQKFYEYITIHKPNKEGTHPPIMSAKQLSNLKVKEELFLVENLIPSTGVAFLVGMPDVGKSLLAKQLCIQIANDSDNFLGFPISTKKGKRALYLSTEDGFASLQASSDKQHAGLGIEPLDNLEVLFPPSDLTPNELEQLIDIHLELTPAAIVVIDGFGDVFSGGDMNSNSEVRQTLNRFYAISQRRGCVFLFLHHLTKAAYTKTASQEHVQGAASSVQKARSVIHLKRSGNQRILQVLKANGVSDEMKKKRYQLNFVSSTLTFSMGGEVVAPPISKESSTVNADEPKKSKKEEEKKELINALMNDLKVRIKDKGIEPGDLKTVIMMHKRMSEATAARLISELKLEGLLEKSSGKYYLPGNVPKTWEELRGI